MFLKDVNFAINDILDILSLSPAATAIYSFPEMKVIYVNDKMLKLWKEKKYIKSLTPINNFTELKDEFFIHILKRKWQMGMVHEIKDAIVKLDINGHAEINYFDFIYQPLKNSKSQVYCILHTVTDVTERFTTQQFAQDELLAKNEELTATIRKLTAINKVQMDNQNILNKSLDYFKNSEERLRFSIGAANVGTWVIDAETRQFIPSVRLKELFGYGELEDMSYESALAQIHDDYRQKVIEAVEKAIIEKQNYNIEYPVFGFHDQKLRWVKAFGKLDENKFSGKCHFSGIIIDITEQKEEEIRKQIL